MIIIHEFKQVSFEAEKHSENVINRHILLLLSIQSNSVCDSAEQ